MKYKAYKQQGRTCCPTGEAKKIDIGPNLLFYTLKILYVKLQRNLFFLDILTKPNSCRSNSSAIITRDASVKPIPIPILRYSNFV